jgi:hypothetical protein
MTNLSQNFHDRARQSGVELRKIVISLSTGALAICFLVLTREIKPVLTILQQKLLLVAVCFFGLSVFGGIVSWWSDGARFFYLAQNSSSNQSFCSDAIAKAKQRRTIVHRLSDVLLSVSFTGGILLFNCIYPFYVRARCTRPNAELSLRSLPLIYSDER